MSLHFLKSFLNKALWKFWLIVALLLTIPSFFSLLRPGYFPMQDDMQAFKIYEIDKCFSDFQIPCRWSANSGYGYGEPVFNFYSPFTYYLGETIHLLGFQFIDSVKIVFVLGFLLSTLFMFLLTSRFFGPYVGFVSGLLYTYAPIRAQEVYVRGAMPEFFAVSLLPLVLFLAHRLVKEKSVKNVAYFSTSLGILFLTHNITTFIFLPVLFIWLVFWVCQEKDWHAIKPVFFSGLLALCLSAFFVLPMIIEKGYVHIDSILTGYFDYRRHFLSLKQIFFSNTWGYGSSDLGGNDDLALNSGLVLLFLGFLSLPLSFLGMKKRKDLWSLVLVLGVSEVAILFLMHLKSEFVYRLLPALVWLQFPWRFLTISVLILTILSAVTLNYVGKVKYAFGLLVILAMFILHGSFFRPVSWLDISDTNKFSELLWEKQLTISIFDYLPKSATLPPNKKAPDIPEVLVGKAEFLSYEKGSYFQKGTVEVSEGALIRVPMIDFPGMAVYVDGEKVVHNVNCANQEYCFGLITFEVPDATHAILVRLEKTPVRVWGEALSVLGFGILSALILKEKYGKIS